MAGARVTFLRHLNPAIHPHGQDPITGRPLPAPTGRRGRRPDYASKAARDLHQRLKQVESLLQQVAEEDGFTYDKEVQMRSRLGRIANWLNRNREAGSEQYKADQAEAKLRKERQAARDAEVKAQRAARRNNPATAAHALLRVGAAGECFTVCGHRPPSSVQQGVWLTSCIITECAELVDCPECLQGIARE